MQITLKAKVINRVKELKGKNEDIVSIMLEVEPIGQPTDSRYLPKYVKPGIYTEFSGPLSDLFLSRNIISGDHVDLTIMIGKGYFEREHKPYNKIVGVDVWKIDEIEDEPF